MQHRINLTQIGPRGEAMADAIQACVHCGFCLAACPTYQLLGEEMDSPRGRIYLMKSVLEGELEPNEAAPYIDRCLGCVGCVPACPSGVQYGELLMGYRALQEEERKRPFLDSLSRTLIAETLPHPNRFRLAATTGKLGKLVQGLLPEQLGNMLNLLPDSLPAAQPLPAFYPAQGKRRARVALLTGCVQSVLAPDINWATVRVLAANGVETIIPPSQGCCGSILMHTGEDKKAMKLARQNIGSFPIDNVDTIITNAAGCGSGMHEYGLLFKGRPEETAATQFAHKVNDITTFLAELGIVAPLTLSEPLTAVYQDACHLNHAQGVSTAPRQLLQAIDNLTLIDLNDGGLCCGSAGTYNLEQPALAHQLGQRKVDLILATKADAVVSGNIGCLTQIELHLGLRERPLSLYHTIQLLDMAIKEPHENNTRIN